MVFRSALPACSHARSRATRVAWPSIDGCNRLKWVHPLEHGSTQTNHHPRVLRLPSEPERQWLDLESLARVEATSEDPAHPLEAALLPGGQAGWRAAQPGEQTLRILFDSSQSITLIHLRFVEVTQPRTQEFVLRWSAGEGQPYWEIVRQQYHFSPPASETENYKVELPAVMALELTIIPHIGGGNAHASLEELRLA